MAVPAGGLALIVGHFDTSKLITAVRDRMAKGTPFVSVPIGVV